MKTKNGNSSESRSQRAEQEPRDSQGRFTSESNSHSKRGSSSSSRKSDGRGSNAENQPRDSQGRFTSKK